MAVSPLYLGAISPPKTVLPSNTNQAWASNLPLSLVMPKHRQGFRPSRSSRCLAVIAWTRQVAPGTRGAMTRTAQISRTSGIAVRILQLPVCRARTLVTHRNGRIHKASLTQANRTKLCSKRLRSAELRRRSLRTTPTLVRVTPSFSCLQQPDQDLSLAHDMSG
jgi:hypothetical protein